MHRYPIARSSKVWSSFAAMACCFGVVAGAGCAAPVEGDTDPVVSDVSAEPVESESSALESAATGAPSCAVRFTTCCCSSDGKRHCVQSCRPLACARSACGGGLAE